MFELPNAPGPKTSLILLFSHLNIGPGIGPTSDVPDSRVGKDRIDMTTFSLAHSSTCRKVMAIALEQGSVAYESVADLNTAQPDSKA